MVSLAVTGCFADPPDVGDGDDESGTSTSSPATGSSTSDTGSTASTDDVSTSSTSTSGTDATADASSTSSSTGDAPVCECPSTAVLCESFEGDFAFVDEWDTNAVGAADPTTTTRFAACGDTAVVVQADADTQYVQVIADLLAGAITQDLVTLHLSVRPGEGCLAQGPTRVAELQFLDPSVAYFVGLWITEGSVDLRIQDIVGGTRGNAVDAAQIVDGGWVTFDVQIDFAEVQPRVDFWIDSEHVLEGASDLMVVADPSTLALHLPMGAFRGGALFEGDCAIALDDVWLLNGGA